MQLAGVIIIGYFRGQQVDRQMERERWIARLWLVDARCHCARNKFLGRKWAKNVQGRRKILSLVN